MSGPHSVISLTADEPSERESTGPGDEFTQAENIDIEEEFDSGEAELEEAEFEEAELEEVGGEPEADEEVGGEPEADGEVGGEPEADEEAMGAAQRLQAAANEVRCGDSRIEGTELCDDGNAVGGDGCSADCQRIEPGFTCPNEQGVGGLCAVDNQIERIDTLDWLLPCDQPGCSVAHIGAAGDGHNLHFYLSERDARSDRGIAYHVKGADQRCWEQLAWDQDYISIPFDNCWWGYDPYRYTRYADGRWLKRWWAPGESFDTDHRYCWDLGRGGHANTVGSTHPHDDVHIAIRTAIGAVSRCS